ncbi:MAG: radical SAM protein [Pseudonocardiaceae bacterium]
MTTPGDRPEYLFVRILEACNADCFMCEFASSRDRYRLEPADLRTMLDRAAEEGIKYVRLTGGEPLLHRNIVDLVQIISDHGMLASIITNGARLSSLTRELAAARLAQVVVSIDAAEPTTHNTIRNTPRLFERAVSGLRAAIDAGVLGRVNTVCGPSNFRQMPALQDLLTQLRVSQWELSSLKLERPLDYTTADRSELDRVVEYVYRDAAAAGRLVPTGKVWCGERPDERSLYLRTGITPRADGVCHLTRKVRYIDAKAGFLYSCSLIVHRPNAASYGARTRASESFSLLEPDVTAQAEWFREHGPRVCTGCSSTAAGYSNLLARGRPLPPWSF